MSEKHTPLPWKYHDDSDGTEAKPLITFDDHEIGETAVVIGTTFLREEDGPYIALACNCHDELLEAARYALGKLESLCKRKVTEPGIAEESLRAAIAKAEGTT